MDHNVVVRQKMTERYLLDELDPAARDEFEEHYFDCPECAVDVRAASAFIDQTKVALANERVEVGPQPVRRPAPPRVGWLAWLRPALAAPALAVLLAVVGYQNLWTLPQMARTLNSPNVLPWTTVNLDTFGGEGNIVRAQRGSGFVLFLRMPAERNYSTYKADLLNPAGKLEWSLTIPAVENQDQLSVQVPAGDHTAGTYTLQLHGISATGDSKMVGRALFEVQLTNSQ